jgi:hypothetical protein
VDLEIGDYPTLAKWLRWAQDAGLYAGLWAAAYGKNAEAEASCMAEVLVTLNKTYNATSVRLLNVGRRFCRQISLSFGHMLSFTGLSACGRREGI